MITSQALVDELSLLSPEVCQDMRDQHNQPFGLFQLQNIKGSKVPGFIFLPR